MLKQLSIYFGIFIDLSDDYTMTDVKRLFDLGGKVAIVTGGGYGLGKQMAEGLAEAGADLVICSRNVARCEETATKIQGLGVRALAIELDVTKQDSVQGMAERVEKEFGSADILVNNSGTAWAASPEDAKLEDWNRVIETNLTGAFLCSQRVGRIMIRQKSGKIINVSSIAGMLGFRGELLDTISYSASKGALNALTRDLAVKWAKYNINVNALAPSFFPTQMTEWIIKHRSDKMIARTPLGTLGGENDLKGPVVFLASEASKFITGQVLAVDGGWSISA